MMLCRYQNLQGGDKNMVNPSISKKSLYVISREDTHLVRVLLRTQRRAVARVKNLMECFYLNDAAFLAFKAGNSDQLHVL